MIEMAEYDREPMENWTSFGWPYLNEYIIVFKKRETQLLFLVLFKYQR